ncbi:PQQ-dependent sugar dehydrogenase [Dermatobacter hominis]|uniref:PQQ-dependent sugar dehydrogenase n=1 Tax=Dermatobacter hominis TaxID=2884263 RepID=UPI001D0FBC95|nr:PQQ-dependent sugar dehydrogenase [Dermatobacter hominis]UDY34605.1 PQQ-dependent sugar dehydrogenase [Dermatobacter hominis]
MIHGRLRPALLGAVALAATGLLVGCADDDDGAATTSTGAPASTTTAAGAGAPSAAGDLGDASVRLVDLGLEADSPIDLTFRPGSTSLIVAERGGAIREAVRDGDGYRLLDDPVIDLTDAVGSTASERGMLGVAVSPDGEHLYVSYTEASEGDSRIVQYPLTGDDGELRAEPAAARQLVAIDQPFANHNGGALRFGTDGMLYAGFGDGGSGNDPEGNGQARDTLLGKILRIDPSAPDGVPADNPFASGEADGRPAEPLIWATGLRNPWRIDIDPATGDLWVADVGQNEQEEVDRLAAADGGGRGVNLGWDLFEGTNRIDEPDPAPGAASAGPFVEPVLTYTHDEGCSITGGVVVRDPQLPALDGAFLFGDFCQPWIRAVRVGADGNVQSADLGLDVASVVSFARGPDDEVLVVSLDGTIGRLAPA